MCSPGAAAIGVVEIDRQPFLVCAACLAVIMIIEAGRRAGVGGQDNDGGCEHEKGCVPD